MGREDRLVFRPLCVLQQTSFPVSIILLPDEGYYQSGRFQFEIDVPEAYNMVVSARSACDWCGGIFHNFHLFCQFQSVSSYVDLEVTGMLHTYVVSVIEMALFSFF